MDIEQLSKNQIVLLTLLVSFVTSIATGIVTVSLMEQAPPAIAQTVNRVIERTVEKVVPGQAAASVVTQEKTVVVRESELISQAVERISPSVVRLYAGPADDDPFIGLGIVLGEHVVLADSTAVGEGGSAAIGLPDGTRLRAFVTSRDTTIGVSYLEATSTTALPALTPASLSSAQPVLGQTVFMLSGKTVARIGSGIIESLLNSEDKKTASPLIIDTDITSDLILPGSPLVDTDGMLIGFSTSVSRFAANGAFISASELMKKEESKTADGKDPS
jgi:hypothetical protein